MYVSKASTQDTTRPSLASARESLTARSEAESNRTMGIAESTKQPLMPLTEFGEHPDDGLLVGRVDDVGDGGGGGEAERVHADPALSLGRGVEQRRLERHLARVPQIVFDGHLQIAKTNQD